MKKNRVLLLPAWYPCDFFYEPMHLLSDEYDFKVLLGHRFAYGKKKTIRKILQRKFNYTDFVKREGYFEVNYSYINSLPYFYEKRQIEFLTDKIGYYVLEIFGGEKPDLIHIQSISDTAVFVIKWAKKNNVPCIITEHILFIRHQFDYFSKLRDLIYEEVDEVLCVSNYLYRNLLTSGFKMKKVSVIGNFVDDSFLQPNFYENKKNGKAIFVASHLADKDISTLMELAMRIQREQVKYVIDIYGLIGNEQYEKNKTLLDEICLKGIDNVLVFKGKVSHKELLSLYSDYSLLLSTSVSETFGLSVAEAIAYGTPVVCTDSGGIRDFVNESNGIIVPIKDVDSLYNAVMNISLCVMNNQEYSFVVKALYGRASFKNRMCTIYRDKIQ